MLSLKKARTVSLKPSSLQPLSRVGVLEAVALAALPRSLTVMFLAFKANSLPFVCNMKFSLRSY